MKTGTFIIGNKLGIHTRPAAEIAKLSAKYGCVVKLEANDKTVDARSVLMIISIGAKLGTTLNVSVEGDQEEELFDKLCDYIGNNFYED